MPHWEFVETDVSVHMNWGIAALVMKDINGTPTYTILASDVRRISTEVYSITLLGATLCPLDYMPINNQIFPGGKGTFTGTSNAEFLTLIGSNPRIGSIAGPNPQGNICVIPFNWQQNSSTEPRAEDAHKLIPIELSKLDTKALKECIKVYEDAKIRYSDNAEVHPPGIL
jgi:hypothetical protein